MHYRERDEQYSNHSNKTRYKKKYRSDDYEFTSKKKPMKKDKSDKYKRYDTEDL
jgi:hypothetical protein